jgi:fucose 4-O-acetylase-like acetyltransferase
LASSASHRKDLNSNAPPRVDWVDFAKGLGIFLVVFGHTLGGLSGNGVLRNSAWSDLTQYYIYIFHMPLFFFLAGMFVARSARRTFHNYFVNKASIIIYPYFLWSILEGTLQYYASRYTNNHLSATSLLKIIFVPIDQYWFLYTIFLMYMTYWYIHRKNVSDTNFLLGALLLYTVQVYGLNIVGWEVFHAFCSFLIYFALGAKAAGTSLKNHNSFNGLRLSGVVFGGYVLIAVAVAANVSEMPFLRAVLAVIGTVATIALAMLLSRSSIWSFVRIMGIYSLEIYVSHTIFTAATRIAIQNWFGDSWSFLQIVVGTSVGICIPMLLAVLGPKIGVPWLFTWSRSRQNTETLAFKLPTA